MKTSHSIVGMGLAALVLFSLALSGCSSTRGQSPPPNPVAQQSSSSSFSSSDISSNSSSSSPSDSFGSSSRGPAYSSPSAPRPQFLDFPDIPIPNELSVVAKDSYVFQSGSLKAGVLTLKGRVDLASLINFFQMAMPRENWKAKGGFRYQRSVLIFDKPDKTCIIKMFDKMYYSYVEIYVAPASGQI